MSARFTFLLASVALTAVRSWLASHPDHGIDEILFVLRGSDVMSAFATALDTLVKAPAEPAKPEEPAP